MLIKLTGLPHPDLNHHTPAVYIDSTRVLVIERGEHAFMKKGSQLAYAEAIQGLREEVERLAGEANVAPPNMVPENEEDAKKIRQWINARESAAALRAAYDLVARASSGPEYHPMVDCTVIKLACGTGLEHGVMLASVYVAESPEQVAEAITHANPGFRA